MSDSTPVEIVAVADANQKKERKPKKKTNKEKAESLALKNPVKVSLSVQFTGFTPQVGSVIEVELDHKVPERFASYTLDQLKVTKDLKFRYPRQSTPNADAMHALSANLSYGSALKLIHSTPASGKHEIGALKPLESSTAMVPKSFIEVLHLMGKTDFGDSKIRVQHNGQLIRLQSLKMIWHHLQLVEFRETFDYLVNQESLDKLKELELDQLYKIVFPTQHSLDRLKKQGRSVLDKLHNNNIELTVETTTITVSPPFLKRNPTTQELIDWMQQIRIFPDHRVDLATAALLSNFKANWFYKLDVPLSTLEPRFHFSWLSVVTPRLILTAGNYLPSTDFFSSDESFAKTVDGCAAFNSTMVSILAHYIDFTDMSINAFGHPAQLVTVPDDEAKKFESILDGAHDPKDPFGDLEVVDRMSSTVCSGRPIGTPGQVLTAAGIKLTKRVDYRERFRGNTTVSLSEIVRRIVARSFNAFGTAKGHDD